MRMKITPIRSAVLTAGTLVAGAAATYHFAPAAWLEALAPRHGATAAQVQPAGETPPAAAATAMPVAARDTTTPVAALDTTTPVATTAAGTPDYRAIVRSAGPAVVGITVSGARQPGADAMDGMPPFFRGMPNPGRAGKQPFRGQGSGFIVSADGLILTNAHVVDDASEVIVKLSDRREFSAKVLGSDNVTDVAVLRIDAKDLPTVRLGNPDRLEVGDPVLAIGAPYGLEQTATQGMVSAKGRSLPGDSSVVPFIQTDAAVNPGNSGGPLFDGQGFVVGINAQIYSQSGGFQGLSFAIPIDVALKVKDQIVATGRANHGRLGVAAQDMNQALAESFGLKSADGALVSSVVPGSAAAAAGLKAGDVILAVGERAIERAGSLSSAIGLSTPGQTVKLKVWRDGGEKIVEARLGGAQGTETVAANGDAQAPQGARLGLSLRPLSPQEKRGAGIDQGMVVEQAGGPAAQAGIEVGDVLVAINGKPVQSVEQIRGLLANKPKSVALLVQRDGQMLFVPVTLG
jgi:serine protease Do